MTEPATRLATPADVADIAALFRRVRQAALPYLPDLHSEDEDRAFFADRVMNDCTVWVAEIGDRIAGFCAYRAGWVDHLYVDAGYWRQGIGTSLLGKAMEAEPRLELWAFERNPDAVGFYIARGFVVVERTDGEHNAERMPDVRLAWVSAA